MWFRKKLIFKAEGRRSMAWQCIYKPNVIQLCQKKKPTKLYILSINYFYYYLYLFNVNKYLWDLNRYLFDTNIHL